MAAKICPKCKTRNPAIYTHCIRCGSPLPVEVHTYTSIKYVAAATVIMLVILAIVYVVVPALHLSVATGKNMSEAIKTGASATPVPVFAVNDPARFGDIQVTVTQVRMGDNTINSGRFCTVTVSVQNFATGTSYSIPAGDFVLADADGTYYYSTGIGSKVAYDAGPESTGMVDLVYIVPQAARDLQLHYTFPTSSVMGAGRQEVVFSL